jgi:hypothetical protein
MNLGNSVIRLRINNTGNNWIPIQPGDWMPEIKIQGCTVEYFCNTGEASTLGCILQS